MSPGDSENIIISDFDIPILDPGMTYAVPQQLVDGTLLDDGVYSIGITIDAFDLIVEGSERDNSLRWHNPILIKPVPDCPSARELSEVISGQQSASKFIPYLVLEENFEIEAGVLFEVDTNGCESSN